MKIYLNRFLLSPNSSAGAQTNSSNQVKQIPNPELEKLKDDLTQSESKISELQAELTRISSEKELIASRFKELETNIKEEYLSQLLPEHRNIAKLIPSLEGLKQYVKINSAYRNSGTDSVPPGRSITEFLSAQWDDLSFNQKEELRVKNPDLWKKLCKQKFGFSPK